MEKFQNVPLTEQEQKTIFELSHNADPTSRLKSNYYQLRRKQIHQDYVADLASQEHHDYNERQKFQQQMDERLKELQAEYEADINLAIELHLATLNVWQPWRTAS